jgi:hypothetical protein
VKRKISLVMAVLLLFSVSSFMFANAKDVKDVKAAKEIQVAKVADAAVKDSANKIKIALEPVAPMTANTAAQTIEIKGSINAAFDNVAAVKLFINNTEMLTSWSKTQMDGTTQFAISTNAVVLTDFSVKVIVELSGPTQYEKSMKVEVVEIGTQVDVDDAEDDAIEAAMNYPAAPAIAAAYLKEIGKPNRYEGTNIISLVAKEATLKAMNKEDAGFEAAVKTFVDAKITEIEAKIAAVAAALTTQETVKTTPAVKVNEKANENAGKKTK